MRLLTVVCILVCLIQTSKASQPTAKDGVLDLRGRDFAKAGIVELNGQWEFYPWKYYSPKEFLSANLPAAEYVHVPSSWTEYSVGRKKMAVFGYATFRLKIVLDSCTSQSGHALALGMPTMFSAYKLWIDTTLAIAVGVPGNNAMEHRPKIVPATVPLFAQKDTVVITIQMANYFFPQLSGMPFPIKIGLYEQIIGQARLEEIVYIGQIVFTVTLGIYFCFFFFLSPVPQERKIGLLFAFACLIVVMRCLVDRALIIMLIFPDFDPALRLKLLFMSFDFFPLLLWTAMVFFPDMISRTIVQSSLVLFALYSLILLLTPLRFGGRLNLYFATLSTIISFYVAAVSGLAYRQKRESAGIFFYGSLFAAVVFSNNMFFTFVHPANGYYVPIESMVYLVLVASAITLRMVHSREREIQLSSDLQAINKNLEQLVAERTKDLHAANESLKKLNSSKDRFISILSHDLRNPLYNLIGLSRRLMRSAGSMDKKKIAGYAEVINESAVAGHKLVENVLDWSLIESGHETAVPEKLVLKTMVDDAFDLLRIESEEKRVKLINDVDSECRVFADARMTAGILRNLLTNGIKFTHKGGKVRVSAIKMADDISNIEQGMVNGDVFPEKPPGLWKISVEDNGVGMETDTMGRLFQIDKKVYSLGTDDEPGSGYGLILTKEFVESNGGTIFISSVKEKGTMVSFTLPAW